MLKWIVAALILWWFLRSKGALRGLGLPGFLGDIPAGSPGYVPPGTPGCSDCAPITMGQGAQPIVTGNLTTPTPMPIIRPVSNLRIVTEPTPARGAPAMGISLAKSPAQVASPFDNPKVRAMWVMSGGKLPA